jgi:predicted Zn-ribbon and HTH transcriptional regulator
MIGLGAFMADGKNRFSLQGAAVHTFRQALLTLLTDHPRSVSAIARELGMKRGDVEDGLRHALLSARAAGRDIVIVPARCRACGFTFGEERLSKPGKCPSCRGTRLYEPQIGLRPVEREQNSTASDGGS